MDDNSLCNSDNECGTSVCNVAGFCGKEKIVSCEPYGKLNCKNQTCLTPSTKELGDAYMCEFECKSKYGNDNICIRNPKTTRNLTLLFLAFLILIGGFGAILIKRAKGNKIADGIIKNAKEKEREILNKAENKARGIITQAEEKLGRIDIYLEDKRLEKEKLERDLELLDKDAKSVRKIKTEILKTTEEIKDINKKKQEEINKLLKTYKERYGPEFVLDNGYIRFTKSWLNPSEKGSYFHIWLFENHHKRKIKQGYEIHHKDFNKLNNNIENLEELTPKEHQNKHLNRYR